MPIPLYLAMTAAEFSHCDPSPDQIAWMACHFSPYGTGLTNCPRQLPPGSLLILNDRTPVCGHDPQRIAAQLNQIAIDLDCAGILLDLQHPGAAETARIVKAVCAQAPCPIAVSEHYCQETDCAVFLTPPVHIPLNDYLIQWRHRQVWLEAATEEVEFLITDVGCHKIPLPCPPGDFPHTAPGTFSRYNMAVEKDSIRFSFRRSKEDVMQMAQEAENVHCMVGLFQQFQ